MSTNPFIPSPEEQASEILEELDEEDVDVAGVEPDDVVDLNDPDKPVSLNFEPVAEAVGAVDNG